MSRTTLISAALAVAALGGATGSALAQDGGTPPTGSTDTTPTTAKPANPCLDTTRRPRLRCPDLIMYRPYDLYYDHVGGRTLLHAGNSIVNIGRGPAENFGVRSGQGRMKAFQHIYAVDGSRHSFDNGGRLVFKQVPGYGNFWKFYGAARFEIWKLGAHDELLNRVRIGPKLIYCLRDLNKRFSSPISPSSRHFPGCNQNAGIHFDTLGTSVGWSDDYPATYPQQYVDVTGLRGRFAFFQRVDPFNRMWELNENNNSSPMIILNLPRRTPASNPSSGYGGY
jgi:hypothetical protein